MCSIPSSKLGTGGIDRFIEFAEKTPGKGSIMATKLRLAWKATARGIRKTVSAANSARDSGDWKTAAVKYQEALEARPDLQAIWVQYGNMLKEDRKFEAAEAAYLRALRLAPEDADAHLMYGHLLKITNRLDEAAAHYHKSALLDPGRPDARLELNALAERGVGRAQVPLPPRNSNPHTWSLNAKLAGARMQIAEVLTELEKRESRQSVTAPCQSGEYQKTLAAAYDSITTLIRGLNNWPRGTVVEMSPGTATQKLSIVFDTSDLIQYFRHHRLPTGIQRVQMETIYVGLMRAEPALDIRVCCFTEAHDYWREVPPADFMNLCELSLIGNDWTAPDWRTAMFELDEKLRTSPNFVFPEGSYLVNIGTSWWLQNYFLYVREAKLRHHVKYVPFVHDMIPIMTPEHCVTGLTQDFISWVLGVFRHADYYFVNSESTRRDLHKVATILGYEVGDDRIHTVLLDADFRKGKEVTFDPTVLLTHRLKREGYVLFVSTIESRKNHLAAFDAWLQLCKKYGVANVPKLVCVGIRGWLNDAVFSRLGSSAELRDRVVMLSGVPERVLAMLYDNCLFTLFPSFYEGWGLPISESLCHGKVPLVSNSSSLPEAGGEFAEYFELGSEKQLIEALERLMFDDRYRRGREALIRQKYRPRRWEDICDDIITAIERWQCDDDGADRDRYLPTAAPGRYYGLNRNTETEIYRGMVSGEIFRTGEAWWGCDDWGCWTKPGSARMVIHLAEGEGEYRLYLGLRGLPEKDTPYDVTVADCATIRGVIKSQKTKWLWFDLTFAGTREPVVNIVLQGFETDNSRPRPEEEPRTVALGVIGFMICRQDDFGARADFIEAVALDNLERLARLKPVKPVCP